MAVFDDKTEREAPPSPETFVLDTLPVEHVGLRGTVIRFSCPEFTSMCPILKQPDFARIYIDYVPAWPGLLVESKSLKFYMQSFRNHSSYHEACNAMIAQKIIDAVHPQWIRVTSFWYPRGGIPIDVFYEAGVLPEGITAPTLDINQLYRGR